MKLTEMYENMQKRYAADAEEKRKSEEAAAKKAEADKNMLKEIIYELIDTVKHELEGNMQEVIYQKFWRIRQTFCPNAKKLKTSLICNLTDEGFFLTVCVNCYKSSYNDDDGYRRNIELELKAMKQFTQYMVDHYNAEDDSIEVTFEFLMNDNTVTITWDFKGNTWKLKDDFKEIFKGSVHRMNGVDKVILSLD